MKKLIYFITALIITSTAFAQQKWDWFAAIDKDKDAKVTETEWIARAKSSAEKKNKKFNENNSKTVFKNMDKDKNGTVSRDELEAFTPKNKNAQSKK